MSNASIAKVVVFLDSNSVPTRKSVNDFTALSFKIELKYPKDVYFIAKMPNFAHSDAEAPPSVFLHHMNKNF